MDNQNKNLILATALSFIVILVWFVLFPPPEPVAEPSTVTSEASAPLTPPAAAAAMGAAVPAAEAQPEAARIAIDTAMLSGSISLDGGRLDDLSLKKYHETVDKTSPIVRLLSPVGTPSSYYTLYGWTPGGTLSYEDVPGPNTQWTQVGSNALTTDSPVTLEWDNGKGLTFVRRMAIDDHYMFTVTQEVRNASEAPVTIAPYGIIARHGKPEDLQDFFVLHEGVVGRIDGELQEIDYDDIAELRLDSNEGARAELIAGSNDGWIGFTDKYWMTSLVPTQGAPFTAAIKYIDGSKIFQTETRQPAMTVLPGESASSDSRLFAGAKEWETIRYYQDEGHIAGFVDSIDWGWFFFLTKPIFWVLHWLNAQIGNMGLAIIALTVLLKALVLPLAYKSYVSMARMKELQPEIEAMKERVGDDRQKMQAEMMKLYREKKVNPAAGCLPILIQIPIFFSLYKVIFVTLELRHAPFFGWIRDLSAPDQSSLYNLFGLLPWAAPAPDTFLAMVFIGVLPLLLGISMWLQQKLNPTPADPTQAMVFAWMPWIFMFMLGSFASGLVVYWIANNVITFTQQYLIMLSHGSKPDIFGNIKAGFKRRPKAEAAKAEKKK